MSWRVGDNELAARSCEGSIRDIDRDALLALGFESIDEQREIEFAALCPERFRITRCCCERIFVHRMHIVQKSSDERALSIINAAAGKETQDVLAFMLREVSINVGIDEVRVLHGEG